MSFDAATISAIVVILAMLAFVVLTIRTSERRTERKIREVARQTRLISRNELARELCRIVHKRYPDACPGLDFSIREDEHGVHISAWYMDHPRPDAEGAGENR